ncbi:MAG: tryptophan 7-halogenase [Bacteroidota bacterium]
MSRVDVIVVGAGPAGCAAAISCLQGGLTCMIINREQTIWHQPGETLHPGIESLFQQLGVDQRVNNSNFFRHEGIWIKWNHELKFSPYGKVNDKSWFGYQIPRIDLNTILLNRVIELGGIILEERVSEAIFLNQKVQGIRTEKNDYFSTYVIDASGYHRWLIKDLKIPVDIYSPPLLAQFGYSHGILNSELPFPQIEAVNHGWIWSAKITSSVYAWIRLYWEKSKLIREFVPDVLINLETIGRTRTIDVTWRLNRRLCGNGFFIVGDAASILDPAASSGVLHSIMSGIMVGYLIHANLRRGLSEEVVGKYYTDWYREYFSKRSKGLLSFYLEHFNPPAWNNYNTAILT